MRLALAITCVLLIAVACKKEVSNPYDDIVVVAVDNPTADDLPEGNFAWLHGKIFAPTCANSGCHDGTFEPEFLTISSSYNSLVNHGVIANDAAFSFDYRVVPGDVQASLLHERLTVNIPNTSGIMPLETEPESDWDALQSLYINHIEDWINDGAPDMFGHLPGEAGTDLPPQVGGFVIFPAGNTSVPYTRDPDQVGVTPIQVDAAPIDLWFYVTDDNTAPEALTSTSLKYGDDLQSFADNASVGLLALDGPILAQGISGGEASFQFRCTIDLTGVPSGTTYFVRTYFDDGAQPTLTETPNGGSNNVITAIFSLEVL